jgi:hypothetical protein
MTERPHGYARYQLDGCRCYVCGFARSKYDENRTKAITAGTWQPWVDADPVRVHIEFLQTCLMGLRTIAALANVDRKRLQAILNGRPERGTGPQEKVRPDLAAAVLAVEPTLDNLGPNTVIDGTGTTRRLRALVAGGWPNQYLADEMGWTPSNFGTLIAASSATVRTARLVIVTYDRLWNVDPATRGATPRFIAEAKARAAEARWAPVGAWDDDTIDDPAAFPDWTGLCGTHRGDSAHRAYGIPICQPCRDARSAYRHELRQRAKGAVAA